MKDNESEQNVANSNEHYNMNIYLNQATWATEEN